MRIGTRTEGPLGTGIEMAAEAVDSFFWVEDTALGVLESWTETPLDVWVVAAARLIKDLGDVK